MKCSIVKLEKFCGERASVYSVYIEDYHCTLFEKFYVDNIASFKSETKNIITTLKAIGNLGARTQFFKVNEGKPGDGVCALYDNPSSKLRLYCIRYGNDIIIVGEGGPKPKNIRALQENEKLKQANYFLRELSIQISERIKNKDIQFSGIDFIGDLDFNDYE